MSWISFILALEQAAKKRRKVYSIGSLVWLVQVGLVLDALVEFVLVGNFPVEILQLDHRLAEHFYLGLSY